MTEYVRGLAIDVTKAEIALTLQRIERELSAFSAYGDALIQDQEAGILEHLEYLEQLKETADSMAEKWADVSRMVHKVITLEEGRL